MSKYKEAFKNMIDVLSKQYVCDFFNCVNGSCPLEELGKKCASVKWTKKQWEEYFMKGVKDE